MAKIARRVAQSACFVMLAFCLASGCGGQSFERGDSSDDGASGEGGTAGSSSGGSENGGVSGSGASNTGGVSARGGAGPLGGAAPMGGAMPTGGIGMSGMAGVGGEVKPNICSLPPETGSCLAAFTRYAFDTETGLCLPFMYGGCDGNANNFQTIESCYMACRDYGPMANASCSFPSDCTLVPSMCCGSCSEPSLANRVAVRKGQESAVQNAMGCQTVDCVPCEATAPNPWLGATCNAERCVAYDLRQTGLVSCLDSSECVLRAGLECCEKCNAGVLDFVALNRAAAIASLACGNGPVACDACVPQPPVGIEPVCMNGRCDVLFHPI